MILQALLVMGLTASGPCELGPAVEVAEPRLAAVYLQTAEEELARGNLEAARVAYREAARLDPGNARARAGWSSVCRGEPAERFSQALERVKAGRCAEAIPLLASLREDDGDRAAALLQGVCHYELGELDAARGALTEAAAAEDLAETANLYLALVALRAGRAGEAARLLGVLEQATADPTLAWTARELAAMARESGRLVVSIGAEAGYDANPYFVPFPGTLPDANGALFTLLAFRPWGATGPYLRAHAQHRNLFLTDLFDATTFGATGGWRLGDVRRSARLEYGYDRMTLGTVPYLRAHRLEAAGTWNLAHVSLLGSYQARWEQIQPFALQGYSGWKHLAHAWVVFGERSTLSLGYRLRREVTLDASFNYTEHGARGQYAAPLGTDVGLRFEAGMTMRNYDFEDPTLDQWEAWQGGRAELLLEAAATLSWRLAPAWQLEASLSAQRGFSTVWELAYHRLVGGVSLSWTTSVW